MRFFPLCLHITLCHSRRRRSSCYNCPRRVLASRGGIIETFKQTTGTMIPLVYVGSIVFFVGVLYFGWPNQPSSGTMIILHWYAKKPINIVTSYYVISLFFHLILIFSLHCQLFLLISGYYTTCNIEITYQCKIIIVPEEGWFGHPKYSTPRKGPSTLCRLLLLFSSLWKPPRNREYVWYNQKKSRIAGAGDAKDLWVTYMIG